MLTELQIANLGVIEDLRVEIHPGLTALTGETGTGKTVLVGAISLLVGARADADLVRPGAEEARVDGRFWLPAAALPADLAAAESSRGDTGGDVASEGEPVEVVISRVISRRGRSRAYVNGHPVTASVLAQITAGQVDLHGQHAHQSLLNPATQRQALDQFGGIDSSGVQALRAQLQAAMSRRQGLGGDERARAREIDLLEFQIAEIDAAQIDDPAEIDRLATEEAILADRRGHLEAGTLAVGALLEEGAARDLLADAMRSIGDRAPFTHLGDRLAALVAELDDLGAELRSVLEALSADHDPERMEQIRQRRQALKDLCRKYGADLLEVQAFAEQARARRLALGEHEVLAERIDAEIAELQEQLAAESARVRAARVAAAPLLGEAMQERLRHLAMPQARVEVRIGLPSSDPVEDPAGDRVEFMLAANPGLESAPLHKVASGGELARAMLALRLALRNGSGEADAGFCAATVIFDEVDAGIGGAAAAAVAEALHRLVDRHQVLVVTHLAQVAAVAEQHLRVVKVSTADSTVAAVHAVEGADRVAEVARMLSGQQTEAAVRHATELLQAASGR